NACTNACALRSINPILNLQSGNLAEMPDVASDERRAVSQCDGRDQEIGAADLFQFLTPQQLVKLGRCPLVDRDDGDLPKQLFTARQPRGCTEKLLAVL